MHACPHSLCFCIDLLEIVDATSFNKRGLHSPTGGKSPQNTDICQIKLGRYNTSKANIKMRTKQTLAGTLKNKRNHNL